MKYLLSFILVSMSVLFSVQSEDTLPKLYIDCSYCDNDFIRSELNFVDHVIDRNVADIFVMITSQNTGSGGREYLLTFSGRNEFKDMNNELKLIVNKDDSSDIVRRKIVKFLKIGLVQYLSITSFADNIDISYEVDEEQEETVDDWDSWVFTIGGNGNINGQKTYRSYYASGYLSFKRVTDEWIYSNVYHASYNEDRYDYGDSVDKYDSQNLSTDFEIVKSLSDHWSSGILLGANNSTYSNRELYIYVYPKIEYNIFPYSESSTREFRIMYGIGANYSDYYETTIYNKDEDLKFKHSLQISFEIKKEWGRVETSIDWSNHLNDFKVNRLDLYCFSSFNIYQGLSFQVNGGYSIIHDQLSIVMGEVTDEDLLLRRRQLETSYNFWTSFGFSYTFGSIYNNVVNPRFGN